MTTIYYKDNILAFIPKKADNDPYVTLFWHTDSDGIQKTEISRLRKTKFFASEFSTGYTALADFSSSPEMAALISSLSNVVSKDLSKLLKALEENSSKNISTETKL